MVKHIYDKRISYIKTSSLYIEPFMMIAMINLDMNTVMHQLPPKIWRIILNFYANIDEISDDVTLPDTVWIIFEAIAQKFSTEAEKLRMTNVKPLSNLR